MQQCVVVTQRALDLAYSCFQKEAHGSAEHGAAIGQRLSGDCAGEEWVQSRGRSAWPEGKQGGPDAQRKHG